MNTLETTSVVPGNITGPGGHHTKNDIILHIAVILLPNF